MSVSYASGVYSNPQQDQQLAQTSAQTQQLLQSNSVFQQQQQALSKEAQLAAVDCMDGVDDGKVSLWEGIKNVGKGMLNMVTNTLKELNPLKHPLKFLGAVATGVVCALCPPVGLALAGAGLVTGGVKVADGVIKAFNAKTDAEAKAAFQEIGEGGLTVAVSYAGAKASVKAMGPNSAVKAQLTNAEGKVKLSNIFKNKEGKFSKDGIGDFGKNMLEDAKNSKLVTKAKAFKNDLKNETIDRKVSEFDKKVSDSKIDDTLKQDNAAKDLGEKKTTLEKDVKAQKESLSKDKTAFEEQKANMSADDIAAKKADFEARQKTIGEKNTTLNKYNEDLKSAQGYQNDKAQLDAWKKAQESPEKVNINSKEYAATAKEKVFQKGSGSKLDAKTLDELDINPTTKAELQDVLTRNGKITRADIKKLNLSSADEQVLAQYTKNLNTEPVRNFVSNGSKGHDYDPNLSKSSQRIEWATESGQYRDVLIKDAPKVVIPGTTIFVNPHEDYLDDIYGTSQQQYYLG